MKTAGIAIDDWKLPIFKKWLDGAGYKFTQHAGLSFGTLLLKVEAESIDRLANIIEASNKEAAQWKKNQLN